MVRRYVGKLYEETITSKHLAEEQKLLFYVPPNYTPLYSYDLLITQDGHDYFQLGKIPRQVEQLIEEGEIRDVIIVGVPYPTVDERRKRYHPNGEKFQAYIRFLAEELVPYLDEQFQTHQLASGRTLAGDSLAATVSLVAALQYPTLFGQVMMHSPYVNDKVLNAVSSYSSKEPLSIYHMIGKEETIVKTTDGQILDFLTPNRELAEHIRKKGFSYTYGEFDGDHTWTHWQKDLPNALITLLS
ncbi:esterase family protein [Halalkalibacterium ligniniphilum]|uniref:esterase family protein n=1 Tax=Halalkalibacterium ligniniphilum TaxID=1134413 RepID=UPI00034DF6EC|nr:esterase family protein [Halalkalibacterium ligniniphilum]